MLTETLIRILFSMIGQMFSSADLLQGKCARKIAAYGLSGGLKEGFSK
jgi:hypothetical protein